MHPAFYQFPEVHYRQPVVPAPCFPKRKGVQWLALGDFGHWSFDAHDFFGTGPEGSGVKVNLFGFQPSEIVKFLVVFFLAGFFATNEQFIAGYSSWRKRWSFFSFALIAIVSAILLFLVLGDLGPALVVCFTFIILFSFSRGDFLLMAGSILLYVFANWFIDNIWIATGVTIGVMLLFFPAGKTQAQ
jgi:cell division protein FtsW (lipid II flippase)